MADKKFIYDIEFRAKSESLEKVKKDLREISNMKLSDVWNLDKSAVNAKNRSEEVVTKMRSDFNEITTAARELENALTKSFNPKLNTVNIKEFEKQLKNLGGFSALEKSFEKAGAKGKTAFRNVSTEILTTQKVAKQTSKVFDKLSNTLANTINWSISSSLLNMFTNTLKNAWKYAVNLDSALNDIRIVTGKSADEMDKFAKKANKMAKELSASTIAYSKASLIYYQQGLGDKDVKARTDVTVKAANVTGQSAAEVSEQLTAVWNGYKVVAEEAELYVDKLAAVAASTASDLEELSTGMSKVASAANAMGVDIDQLTAQISTIVSVTRQDAASVGTALKTIFARMGDLKVDGVDEFGVSLGEVSGTLEKVGINVLDAQGNLRDMGTVIEEVAGKWGTWTEAQQQAIAIAMAGKRQYNNLLALFENWDMYESSLNTSKDAEGTLQKQQDIYKESTQAHIKELQASWDGLFDSLMNNGSMNKLIDVFSGLIKIVDSFVDGIGGGGTLLMVVISGITKLMSGKMVEATNRIVNNFRIGRDEKQRELDLVKWINEQEEKGIKINEEQRRLKEMQLKYSKLLTEEDKARIDGLIKETTLLQNKKDLSKEEYENAIKHSRKEVVFETDPTKIGKNQIGYLDYAKNKEKTATKIDNLAKKSGLGSGLDEKILNKNITKEIEKQYDNRKKLLEILKKEKSLTAEQRSTINDINDLQELSIEDEEELLKIANEIVKKKKEEAAIIANQPKKQQEIDDEEAILEKAKKEEEATVRTKAFADGLSQIASAAMTAISALSAINNVISVFKDETATGEEKIKALVSTLVMIVPTVLPGILGAIKAVKTAGVGAGASIQAAFGWITIIMYALIALVAVVMLAINALKKNKEASDLEKANKELEKTKETAEATKKKLDELKNAYSDLMNRISKYKDAKKGLDELRKGTEEWKQAVIEVNQMVMDLMQSYPELVKYVKTDLDGVMSIEQSGFDFIINKQREAIKLQEQLVLAANLQVSYAERKVIQEETNAAKLTSSIENGTLDIFKSSLSDDGKLTVKGKIYNTDASGNTTSVNRYRNDDQLSAIKDSNSLSKYFKYTEDKTDRYGDRGAYAGSRIAESGTLDLGKLESDLLAMTAEERQNFLNNLDIDDNELTNAIKNLVNTIDSNNLRLDKNGVSLDANTRAYLSTFAKDGQDKDIVTDILSKDEEVKKLLESDMSGIFSTTDNTKLTGSNNALNQLEEDGVYSFDYDSLISNTRISDGDFKYTVDGKEYTLSQSGAGELKDASDNVDNNEEYAYFANLASNIFTAWAGSGVVITPTQVMNTVKGMNAEEAKKAVFDVVYKKEDGTTETVKLSIAEAEQQIKEGARNNAIAEIQKQYSDVMDNASRLGVSQGAAYLLKDTDTSSWTNATAAQWSQLANMTNDQIREIYGADADVNAIRSRANKGKSEFATRINDRYSGYGFVDANGNIESRFSLFTEDEFNRYRINSDKMTAAGADDLFASIMEGKSAEQTQQINNLLADTNFMDGASVAELITTLTDEGYLTPGDEQYTAWTTFFDKINNGNAQWLKDSKKVIDNLETIKEIGSDIQIGSEISDEDYKRLIAINPMVAQHFVKSGNKWVAISDADTIESVLKSPYQNLAGIQNDYATVRAAAETIDGSTAYKFETADDAKAAFGGANGFFSDIVFNKGLLDVLGYGDVGIHSLMEKAQYGTLNEGELQTLNAIGAAVNQALIDADAGLFSDDAAVTTYATMVADSFSEAVDRLDTLGVAMTDEAKSYWQSKYTAELGLASTKTLGFGDTVEGITALENHVKRVRKLEIDAYVESEKKINKLSSALDNAFGAEKLKYLTALSNVANRDIEIAQERATEARAIANAYNLSAYGLEGASIYQIQQRIAEVGADSSEGQDLQVVLKAMLLAEDLEKEVVDKTQAALDYAISSVDTYFEVKLNLNEAKKQWGEFKAKYIERSGVSIFEDLDGSVMYDLAKNAFDDQANVFGDYINGLTKFNLDSEDQNSMNEFNKLLEGAQEQFDGMIDSANEMLEAFTSIQEEINELYEKQIERLSNINSLYSSSVDLLKLVGNKMDGYSDKVKGYLGAIVDNAKTSNDISISRLEAAQRAYNEKNYDKVTKEQQEMLENNLNDAANAVIDSASTLIDAVTTQFQESFTLAIDNAFGEGGLAKFSEEWQRGLYTDERYLDEVNKEYSLSEFERKIQNSIDTTDNYSAQKKLNDLKQKELELLRAKDKITKEDLDRANARYELELKRIALEEAQQTASKMKLTRDASGNYSYQYVADQDAIAKADAEFKKAENDLYNLNKDQEKNLIGEITSKYQEAVEAIGGATTEEEKNILYDYYFGQNGVITMLEDDLAAIGAEGAETGTYTSQYADIIDRLMSIDKENIEAEFTTAVTEFGTSMDNIETTLENAFGENGALTTAINTLTANIGTIDETKVTELLNKSNEIANNVSTIVDSIKSYATDLATFGAKYTDALSANSEALGENTEIISTLNNTLLTHKGAVETATNAILDLND